MYFLATLKMFTYQGRIIVLCHTSQNQWRNLLGLYVNPNFEIEMVWLCIEFSSEALVTDQTFGSAELFGRTSTVRFGPNDRNFFCRTQNFFSCQFNANGIFSYFCFAKWPTCTWSLGKIAKRMPTEPKL